MRKSYYMAVTVGLVLLLCIVVFVKHEGFWVSEQKMTPKQLIESKGYEIVSEEGFVRSYLLTREKLLKFPYVAALECTKR